MAIESQGTKLEIGGTDDTPVTITDVTLGNPTILTSVDHGLTNGDVVTLADFDGEDAALVNDLEFIVQFVTDDTFAIAVDSTDLDITDNTDTATATPLEWIEIGEVISFDGPSGSAAVIDATHLQSTAKEKLMGLPDEGQFTLSLNLVPGDAGQLAAKTARAARAEKDFRVTYSDLSVSTFSGFVLGFASSGGVDGKIDGSITIEITGAVEGPA